jgi:hypothetical protein
MHRVHQEAGLLVGVCLDSIGLHLFTRYFRIIRMAWHGIYVMVRSIRCTKCLKHPAGDAGHNTRLTASPTPHIRQVKHEAVEAKLQQVQQRFLEAVNSLDLAKARMRGSVPNAGACLVAPWASPWQHFMRLGQPCPFPCMALRPNLKVLCPCMDHAMVRHGLAWSVWHGPRVARRVRAMPMAVNAMRSTDRRRVGGRR